MTDGVQNPWENFDFDANGWPDIEIDRCPETGDVAMIIAYDDGARECYHCGAEVKPADD